MAMWEIRGSSRTNTVGLSSIDEFPIKCRLGAVSLAIEATISTVATATVEAAGATMQGRTSISVNLLRFKQRNESNQAMCQVYVQEVEHRDSHVEDQDIDNRLLLPLPSSHASKNRSLSLSTMWRNECRYKSFHSRGFVAWTDERTNEGKSVCTNPSSMTRRETS
jgi:hypothetical protein